MVGCVLLSIGTHGDTRGERRAAPKIKNRVAMVYTAVQSGPVSAGVPSRITIQIRNFWFGGYTSTPDLIKILWL